jgi:hypothetical protein
VSDITAVLTQLLFEMSASDGMPPPVLPSACTFHSYGLNTSAEWQSTFVYNRGLALP